MEPPLGEPRGADRVTVDRPSGRTLALACGVAAVVFLIFESVSGFVAVPLRELSSIAAQIFLGLTGFPVTRSGTILSTPRATFDVVPACSGSTTLQVLLFVAIVWCGVHPRLTPARRCLAILLAVPLAVAANAARVSFLVVAGHIQGGEPDGFMHTLAGLAAFALAMFGCFALTARLATASKSTAVKDRTLAWILGGLLVFLSMPFLAWCLESWSRSLDRFGWLFCAAAAALAIWKWNRTADDRSRAALGTAGLGLSFLALAAATLIDVNVLKGLSLILAFLSLALAMKGARCAVSMVPVALLACLGWPTVSYQMGVLTSWRFTSLSAFLGVKAVMGALLLALHAVLERRAMSGPSSEPARRWLPLQLLMAAALAAFQAYFYGVSGGEIPGRRFEMSYVQGSWIGRDREPPRNEAEYFGNDRIWSRRFTRDRETVDVLITSTGGDRHRAHPPAYCVTGDGWQTVATSVTERRLGDGSTVPLTLLKVRLGTEEMLFTYWFTNGEESHATFSGMLLRDSLGRLGGRRSDWFVIRVMTGSGESALNDFLSVLRARITTRPAPERTRAGSR